MVPTDTAGKWSDIQIEERGERKRSKRKGGGIKEERKGRRTTAGRKQEEDEGGVSLSTWLRMMSTTLPITTRASKTFQASPT